MELVTAIVSSALISAIISGLVAGYFSLKAIEAQYKNEYYKSVLARRMDAYSAVDRLIQFFGTRVVGDNGVLYHLPFTEGMKSSNFSDVMTDIDEHRLWLSDQILAPISELNVLMLKLPDDPVPMMEFGKDHFGTIEEIVAKLRPAMAADMLTLYDVPAFLKARQREQDEPVYEELASEDLQGAKRPLEYVLIGRSGTRYRFKIVPADALPDEGGGLFVICGERPAGLLQELAIGKADNFRFNLTTDIAATLSECGIDDPEESLVFGIYPADEKERSAIVGDLMAMDR